MNRDHRVNPFRLANAIVAAVVLVTAGFVAGQRTALSQTLSMIAAETTGNLGRNVETLARLRTGDSTGAITLLEQALDSAAITIPQGKAWADLDPPTQFAMQLAKAYRHSYPPSESPPGLAAWLDTIPMPSVESCSPAIQALIRRGRQD